MKIVVLGKTGQVGHALLTRLHGNTSVVALSRKELDAEQLETVAPCLLLHNPDVIINAMAYTAVDRAESEPALAEQINVNFVYELAQFAKRYGILLIHYSTDYVFDGKKNLPYRETDETCPLNEYGRTKRDGELAVLTSGCRNIIFRTSWVYSLTGHNFINTILHLARTRTELSVVADQWGAPTAADWIADMTLQALGAYQQDQLAEGIVHLTTSGATSWHLLAQYVVDKANALGLTLQLRSTDITPIATVDYPLPAQRPLNSCLDTGYLTSCLQMPFPDWMSCVDDLLVKKSTLEEIA